MNVHKNAPSSRWGRSLAIQGVADGANPEASPGVTGCWLRTDSCGDGGGTAVRACCYRCGVQHDFTRLHRSRTNQKSE